jgi:hypothetical protein
MDLLGKPLAGHDEGPGQRDEYDRETDVENVHGMLLL